MAFKLKIVALAVIVWFIVGKQFIAQINQSVITDSFPGSTVSFVFASSGDWASYSPACHRILREAITIVIAIASAQCDCSAAYSPQILVLKQRIQHVHHLQ